MSNDTDKATPRPWERLHNRIGVWIDGKFRQICEIMSPLGQDIPNAELIVRAVNCYGIDLSRKWSHRDWTKSARSYFIFRDGICEFVSVNGVRGRQPYTAQEAVDLIAKGVWVPYDDQTS